MKNTPAQSAARKRFAQQKSKFVLSRKPFVPSNPIEALNEVRSSLLARQSWLAYAKDLEEIKRYLRVRHGPHE